MNHQHKADGVMLLVCFLGVVFTLLGVMYVALLGFSFPLRFVALGWIGGVTGAGAVGAADLALYFIPVYLYMALDGVRL